MQGMKRALSLFLIVVTLFGFVGCASDPAEKTTEPEFETVLLETEASTEGESTKTDEEVAQPALPANMNPLTGLECDVSLVGKRPIAVMFNNIKEALPQVGLSKCDIIYEVLAEGGITRLEGLMLDYANAGDLGSIRSARPYYVNIARAYDAIYVHAGGSDAAYSLISSTKIDHFDGVRGNFKVNNQLLFWRDQNRLKSGYSSEHTMFASGDDIAAAVVSKNVRSTLKNANDTAFQFDPEFNSIGSGKTANYIKVPHSKYYISEFNYDSATGLYGHTHYKTAHIDGGTGEQIKVTNVFVLFVQEKQVDSYGRLEVTLTGEGKGYYANGGEYTSIIWKRASDDAPFEYFNEDGSELKVEQGKSYISLVNTKTASSVTLS